MIYETVFPFDMDFLARITTLTARKTTVLKNQGTLVILEHLYSIGVRHHKLSEIVIISCETVFYVCELLFCYFKIIIKLFTLLSIAFNILLLMCFVCDLFWMVLSIVHSLWLSDISIFSTSRETFYAYIILLKWLEQLKPF